MNTTTVTTTTTTVDRHGKPQVSVRAEIPYDLIAARAAELAAMRDPANWHPLIGSRLWPLDNDDLAEALADAEVTGEVEYADGQTLVHGYLGRSRGYEPFFCLRGDVSGRHVMVCPGMGE
ncbi:hypothetical protein [Paraburkholderia sp. J67]|uniref:hypothetical protein n=1 Tax=Paraburkholderia sp. J67 TaxID=2805435 RepID=UPI002ABD6895|nr:hypothetical protein [Paraburkholderia sp. J67]